MFPVEGMKKEPYGLPLMLDAWIGLVHWAIGKETFRERFKKDTGHDFKFLLSRSPIDMMIDKSTGIEREIFVAFCDWVTENLWGDGTEPEEGE